MAYRVFVDGQEGTTGLRIHEYLAQRADVEVLRIDPDKRKDAQERARLLNEADVAFLCLPDDAAREAVSWVTNPRTCLIDASTAHRTDPSWAFALPELAPTQRDALRQNKRLANPGCHATAFILLLRPLVDAGCVSPAQAVSATSLTGYSGGGKKMIERYQAAAAQPASPPAQALLAPRPYALGLSHKHIPEMMTHTGLRTRPLFLPIVGPFYKGLSVSVPLHLASLSTGLSAAKLHAVLEERYAEEPFVRVMSLNDPATVEAGFFDIQAANDTNRVDIFVFAHEETPGRPKFSHPPSGGLTRNGRSGGVHEGTQPGEVVLMARLDNLGKGASGAAVQAMNIHLGVPEDLGL